MNRLAVKIKNNKGESIAETLVALLIAALGLLMLAGSILSAYKIITSSNRKIAQYTAAQNIIVKQDDPTGNRTDQEKTMGSLVITEVINQDNTVYSAGVTCYRNEVFTKWPVLTFKKWTLPSEPQNNG